MTAVRPRTTPSAQTTTGRGASARTERSSGTVLALALVANGLVAGLFFAFSCAVMPGLRHSGDRTFVEAMQEINKAILNPVFYLAFMGALLLSGWAGWQQRRLGRRQVLRWVVASVVLYVAVFLVTSAISVPLNDRLAHAGTAAKLADPGAAREKFETPWVAWNVVRTVLSTGALACLVRALLLHGRATAATANTGATVGQHAAGA